MAKLFDYVKNIFFLLILLQIAPSIIKSISKQYSSMWQAQTKVGILPIKGVLSDGTYYIKQLRKFFENDEIKAIVLKIESPGGAAGTSQAIFNEIKELKKTVSPKFVLALIENVAASGGYYIAASADCIVATSSAFIGSIGAYIPHPDFKDFINQYKIDYEVIKAGEYKAAGNPLLHLTDKQRQHFQEVTDNVYAQFVKDIATERAKASISSDSNIWAQGKIFTGELGLKIGLVDKLGSQSTAMEVLKEHAPIVGKIEWVYPEARGGLLANLFSSDEDEGDSHLHALTKSIGQTLAQSFTQSVETQQSGINC